MEQNSKLLKILAVVLAVMIGLKFFTKDEIKLAPINTDSTILCFGDSLIYGTGAQPEQSFPSVLENITGAEVINAGIPGETTNEGKKRLPALLEKHMPDLVILCEGGNDFLQKNAKSTKPNLSEMITAIKSNGAEVLLLGIPKPGFMLSTADLYYELADKHSVALLEESIADILSQNKLKSDYIHPNAAGYKVLANEIIKRIRQ